MKKSSGLFEIDFPDLYRGHKSINPRGRTRSGNHSPKQQLVRGFGILGISAHRGRSLFLYFWSQVSIHNSYQTDLAITLLRYEEIRILNKTLSDLPSNQRKLSKTMFFKNRNSTPLTSSSPYVLDTQQKCVAMHDALSDYVIAPLGRVNHLQGLMTNISLQANNVDTNESRLKKEDFQDIKKFLTETFAGCTFQENTTSRGKNLTSFYIYVMDGLEFKAFVFASTTNNFICYILPTHSQNVTMNHLDKYFFKYLPGKTFTIGQYDGGDVSMSKIEEKDTVTYDEFYPFIEGGVAKLFKEYYDSRSRLMIFTGPAGTGKSSLMRSMLGHSTDKFVMLDDPSVYSDPDKFNGFISTIRRMSKEERVTVFLEEADQILREKTDGTGALERLLSLTSGVIEHNIKLVIASNIENVDKMYPALTRGGRAFRTIEFRELDVDEANIARKAIDLDEVHFTTSLVLASALNFNSAAEVKDRARRPVGFTPAN